MDLIESIKGSVIQHGEHNDRIYLMRLNSQNIPGVIATLDHLALNKGYGKIFAKIPATAWNAFKAAHYVKEAVIPGFFAGKIDGFFLGKYFSDNRQKESTISNFSKNAKKTKESPVNIRHSPSKTLPDIISCKLSDVEEMSGIFQNVFESYPFPIQDPAYIKRMMNEGILYYGIRFDGNIAALAAAEIDFENLNAEMTDFATLPKWRRRGFAGMLLNHMDISVRKLGIKTAYTIARAASQGMNLVFQNRGYTYAGLLKNNSHICGGIQSMTVWYKHL